MHLGRQTAGEIGVDGQRQDHRRTTTRLRAHVCPGTMVGRYEVLAHLGTGGMASVHLARMVGARGFTKLLAVKLLHTDLAGDPLFVEMFCHEARTVAQLQHDNIVQVIELGEWRGTLFVAMEYLVGETLAAVSRQARLIDGHAVDPRIVCGLGLQACEALHYTHEARDMEGTPLSLVHLDVSPQNLLLTYTGSLVLIDFGIARSANLVAAVPNNPFRAKTSYTSPERLLDVEPDRRSDIFSLGTVLWELLAGRSLFGGGNDLQTMYRVSQAPIPRLDEERDGVPAVLADVVDRALERDRDQRYGSAIELFEALDTAREALGPPVTSQKLAHEMARLFPGVQRHKRATADALALGG